MNKKPNIVLIITEELRNDFLGYMGNKNSETPFLNKLSEESVTFSNYYTVHSKCVPSRVALYSGRYVHNGGHRTLGIPLQKGEINLAKILKDAGYQTYLCGKNHTIAENIMSESFTQHWDNKFLKSENTGYKHYLKETTDNDRTEGSKTGDNYLFGKLNKKPQDTADFKISNQVCNFIKNNNFDKPFFIDVNFNYTHPPYEIMEPYYSKFMNKDLTLFPNEIGKNKPEFMRKLHDLHGFKRLDENDRKEMLACYLGQLNYINDKVEEMYNALRDAGELDNTIFIFTSDHGDFVGQYSLPEKWDTVFHDCLINIPLIIRYPKEFSRNKIDALSENIDLLPTLLDILKIEKPYGIQGKSMFNLMKNKTSKHKDYVFTEGGHEEDLLKIKIDPDPHRKLVVGYLKKAELRDVMPDSLRRAKMIKTNKYKLIYRIKDKNELYDLQKDPAEMNNVYYDNSYQKIKINMEKILINHLIESEDNLPFDPLPIS